MSPAHSFLSALRRGIRSLRRGALSLFIALPLCGILAGAGWFFWSIRNSPASQCHRISAGDVRTIHAREVSDPVLHAYGCWDENEFFPVPSAAAVKFSTLRNGKVPGFSFAGGTFLILHKGRNWSRGVVLGLEDQSAPGLRPFTFKPLPSGLVEWTYDPERRGQ